MASVPEYFTMPQEVPVRIAPMKGLKYFGLRRDGSKKIFGANYLLQES